MHEHHAPVETCILADVMSLVAHCATLDDKSGIPRVPGELRIHTNGAAWVITVVDSFSRRYFSVVAPFLDQAFELADELVRSERPPWSTIPDDGIPS